MREATVWTADTSMSWGGGGGGVWARERQTGGHEEEVDADHDASGAISITLKSGNASIVMSTVAHTQASSALRPTG